MKFEYPRIITNFDVFPEVTNNPYIEAMQRIMSYILPPNFFCGDDVTHRFHRQLPLISWTKLKDPPFNLSFFLCCRFRRNAFRFFHEMLSHWLIPGKRINALLQFAVDFSIPEISDQMYIGGEVMLHIETQEQLEILQNQLPIIETELRIGVESPYQANRILEIKGLTSDVKTALIQEYIATMVKRRPQDFDYDIFSEMQHFLVICKDEFKIQRSFRHMSRIICIHYLFRKALKHSYEAFPDRRYVSVKVFRSIADLEKNKKNVLSIILGMSFLRRHEVFEERHAISAVRSIIPNVRLVENSFFQNSGRSDSSLMLYLEIEKESGEHFTLNETRILKEELEGEIKNHIEQRHHHLFMPQNEEEIIRNIVTLSHQLKYVRDFPQVVIIFNQQTEEVLEFLVIVLRIVNENTLSIQNLFRNLGGLTVCILDRVKNVGTLRKYFKEASVFRLRIHKHPFLRIDHSVDLYKARQAISIELKKAIGEFRDYNGGTISKETELFGKLKKIIGKKAQENAFLLENFFYSLSPPVMRSVLEPEPLKKLFFMILEIEKEALKERNYLYHIEEDSKYFYLLLTAIDPSFHEALLSALKEMEIPSLQLATCFVQSTNYPCCGVICRYHLLSDSMKLRIMIENLMARWSFKI